MGAEPLHLILSHEDIIIYQYFILKKHLKILLLDELQQ